MHLVPPRLKYSLSGNRLDGKCLGNLTLVISHLINSMGILHYCQTCFQTASGRTDKTTYYYLHFPCVCFACLIYFSFIWCFIRCAAHGNYPSVLKFSPAFQLLLRKANRLPMESCLFRIFSPH